MSVFALDMDGDGDIDVLSASQLDRKIAWYENDGNENFTTHTIKEDYTIVTFWVDAADVDGDGDIDVVSSEVAWYENDGNENFTPHYLTTSPNHARAIYAVDVDGDGDVDVVSDKIEWFENLGSSAAVDIDIKPGSDPNCFNINGRGVVPVAILGSESLDVSEIDFESLLFAGLEVRVRGNRGALCSYEYSNDDAHLDLVCHFEDDAAAWEPGDGIACVTGTLLPEFGAISIEGCDSICVVP
jgi:hypothetical protein